MAPRSPRPRTFVTPANGSGFDSINFTILQGEDNESYLRLEGPEYASTTTGCSDVVCSAKAPTLDRSPSSVSYFSECSTHFQFYLLLPRSF